MVCVLNPRVSCDDSRAFPVFSAYQRTALALPIWSALTSHTSARLHSGMSQGEPDPGLGWEVSTTVPLLVIAPERVIYVFIFTGGGKR